MEYKKAVEILIKLRDKKFLTKEEKEAVLTAIGVLDSAHLAKSSFKRRIKLLKAKRQKSTQWQHRTTSSRQT